jgi:hypothetical protein
MDEASSRLLQTLDEKLDGIRDEVANGNSRYVRIELDLTTLKSATEKHELILCGKPENGEPARAGVIGRLQRLEAFVFLYNWALGAAWGILAAILTALVIKAL